MVLTKLSLVAAMTVTLGIVASGAYVWGVPQRESEAPAKSSSARSTAQTDKNWFGEGQNLLAILQAQVDARKAELQREEALTKFAGAEQARNQRLRERGPDYISDADLQKAAVDVRIASAQTDVVRAELREAELRLEQAKQIVAGGNLEKLDRYLVSSATASSVALERRISSMERKLDQILEAMKK